MIKQPISRRRLLSTGASALIAGFALPQRQVSAQSAPTVRVREYRLTAQPHQVHLVGKQYPKTPVWCYNNNVPGPEIRVRQGERLRIVMDNHLTQPTTLHCHGIRLPNNMDGVPGLTQDPIQSGARFVYEFDVPDAGTYWYHPHFLSSEQVARGLHGPLIVEEPEPIQVDRDITWLLDDWRLTKEASISEDFANLHDMSHAGRIGNVATLNGQIVEQFSVRSGERLRLRLINTANARHFALNFEQHKPQVIAIDGQPVTPHEPADGLLVLGPAMRMDIILDTLHTPGSSMRVIDQFYPRQAYRLLDLVYSSAAPLRESPLTTPIQLPPNPLPEPDLQQAEQHQFIFAGGAMGGLQGAILDGEWTDLRSMAQHKVLWAINGHAKTDLMARPLLTLHKNHSYRLTLENTTAFPHPLHLHGHSFRIISRNGQPTPYRPWQDTVLVPPQENADIAFVADNPGDWMFHCHVLEHQTSGMGGFFRVV